MDLVADVLQKQKDGKLRSGGKKKVAQADGVSHTVVRKTGIPASPPAKSLSPNTNAIYKKTKESKYIPAEAIVRVISCPKDNFMQFSCNALVLLMLKKCKKSYCQEWKHSEITKHQHRTLKFVCDTSSDVIGVLILFF